MQSVVKTVMKAVMKAMRPYGKSIPTPSHRHHIAITSPHLSPLYKISK